MRLILFLTALSLGGCATTPQRDLNADVLNLRVGMSKDEVEGVFGKPHSVIVAQQTPRGFLEEYEYCGKWADMFTRVAYSLMFMDSRLVAWQKTVCLD